MVLVTDGQMDICNSRVAFASWVVVATCTSKVCVLDLVQLENNIGYMKSSHTDLSSSN